MTDHRGYCLCCRLDGAHMTILRQLGHPVSLVCRVCQLHQNDDHGGWTKRDSHHRQMWAGQLVEAEDAYLEELVPLEREVGRLRGLLEEAGISSAPPNARALALARIRELHEQSITSAVVIAKLLAEEGFEPPDSDHWHGGMVHDIAGTSAKDSRSGGSHPTAA